MTAEQNDIAKQVLARVSKEETLIVSQQKMVATKGAEIPDAFILECLRANRVGDATLYNTLFQGLYVFHKKWGRWLRWAGHHWQEDYLDTAEAKIEEVCRLYLRVGDNAQGQADDETDKEAKRQHQDVADMAYRRVNLLRDTKGREGVLKLAHRIEEPLAIIGDELDQKPYMVACPNCVIDLRTGEAQPGNPADYILNACPTEWRGLEEPCPNFEGFLLSSMEDDTEMVAYLKRLLGYGLIADRRDHVFIIMWGAKGRNGKDTLIKAIRHTLGKSLCGNVPVEMYLATTQTRNSSAPAADIMALRGMRISFCNEAEDGQRFAIAKLKELTGGGVITARGINDKLMSEWKQTNLPIMSTNELPRAKSDDDAFWARVQIVPWNLRFVDEPTESYERQADKDLEKKLENEASGILAWLVAGALEYLRDGLNPPPKVRATTKERREHYDDVGRFLADCCDIEETYEGKEPCRISSADLYEAFCYWYRENVDKTRSYSTKRFGEVLGKKGLPKMKSRTVFYLGIRLKPEFVEEMRQSEGGRHGD